MQIDTERTWAAILKAGNTSGAVSAKMRDVIAVCSSDFPHPDWSRIAALPFDQDVATLAGWIPSVLGREQPDIKIHGLWFGLCNPVIDDVTAELYFAGAESFDPDDGSCEWAADASWYPEDAYSGSSCLREIYSIAYPKGSGGLGNDAEWSLCLAFAFFALQQLLGSMTPTDFASDADVIGVAVGFDSGDFIPVGLLTRAGLVQSAA